MSAENKVVVRRFFDEIFNEGKLDVADEIIASDYENHDPVNPDYRGPEGVKTLAKKYRDGFSDLVLTIDDMVAEGDRVAGRYSWAGTHDGDLEGIAATGKHATGTGAFVSRVSDGKIQENWVNWDTLGLMKQLGVIPE